MINDGKITGMARDEGWLIHTSPLREEAAAQLPNLGNALRVLSDEGFIWVLFDCDAEPTEVLPVFDWSEDDDKKVN